MSKVVVVGAGNAALCAALSAKEHGAQVIVLERAPLDARGGNSAFTGGSFRVPFRDMGDLHRLMPDLSESELALDPGSYSATEFFSDIARVTEYRSNPDLVEILANGAFETMSWMVDQGVRFVPKFSVSSVESGKFSFRDGLLVESAGAGLGLIDQLFKICEQRDIEIRYEAHVTELQTEGNRVVGVRGHQNGEPFSVDADAVILAAGGFEANAEWRARYLGPMWDLAKVRGSQFNTGDGIKMGLDIGASPAGHWSGCHATGWDLNAPEFGDRIVGDQFEKHSYPFSVMVNANGERFVDEGADLRNFTYAKYGREVLEQPGLLAWQVFDQKVTHLLRTSYSIRQITKVKADTFEELGALMEVDVENFVRTMNEYNDAAIEDAPFQPAIKDGRSTRGLELPKSNWANKLDAPPYEAYGVTCGITFTFGGLRVNAQTEVQDTAMKTIPGLHAIGEMMGGLFYFNYPGGTGLMSGSVFGRLAGARAASA